MRLFGSRARGDARPDSDLDLLVTVPGALGWRLAHHRLPDRFSPQTGRRAGLPPSLHDHTHASPMLDDNNHGLAEGIDRCVKAAILMITAHPSPVLASFLDGTEKMLVIHYNGDREGHTFDPLRGDARVSLLRPDIDGYRLPPSHDPFDSRTNIRAGVPLWLLRSCDEEALVLGIGKLHPRWNAATIDFYDPDTRRHLGQKFFADPRIDFDALTDGHPDLEELQRDIAAAGGAVAPPPLLAPRYPEFRHISGSECLE